jgi:DNA helicase-4
MIALREANPDLKIYCVGDDWQSIYRFTGSDVSLMTDFEKYFGYTTRLKLEVSNRFNDELAQITNEFIQQNPMQIKKAVRSGRKLGSDPIQVLDAKSGYDATEAVLAKLNSYAQAQNQQAARDVRYSVFILGRYSLEYCKHVSRPQIQSWKKAFSNLDIEYHTIHSSKGLTADFVIIEDVVRGTMGIPSEIVDDPLLNLVLCEPEDYPYAEERRVMYVALTRARHKVWLITEKNNESRFLDEVAQPVWSSVPLCPWCQGELVVRTGPYGQFVACSNFPTCEFRKNGRDGSIELIKASSGIGPEVAVPVIF